MNVPTGLATMSRQEKLDLLALLEEKELQTALDRARDDPIEFAKRVYPGFKVGPHHRKLSAIFRDVVEGKKKRVIINIAPRMGKSEFSSYLFPAWFFGRYPAKKIIMATHTASLSEDYGRRVRNLISDAEYHEIFPGTIVSEDQKSAGKWSTSDGGQYYAAGVGGALAGRGADLFVVDDPHSEQDIKANSRLTFDQAWSWYQTGPLQRLMPGGAIIVIMTRWSRVDLTGRLLDYAAKNPDSDQWEVLELPALINEKSLWPEQWPLDALLSKKASMDPRYWSAQYMQQPDADEVALIKRDHWMIWEKDDPPKCEWIIQSWDTAHETKTSADYSACTTWGVWVNEADEGNYHVMLLDAFKDRMEFPELKKIALKHWKKWEPDAFLVEKKAAGAPLIQELRRMGIPVAEFSPSRGNDKTTRGNAIADMFHSGRVWAPDTRWAREVIDEVAAYPVGEHDDYYDTCFVGETPVLMADRSSRCIDAVQIGDMVATPLGPRLVTAASARGWREVWELIAGDRRVLATGDHCVMTPRGWMRVDSLVPGVDTVAQAHLGATPCPSHASLLYESRLSASVGAHIAATPTATTRRTGGTFAALGAACTALCGSITTALFRRGTTCTTSTATRPTTASRTSSACRPSITEPGTDQSEAHTLVAVLRTMSSCELRLLSGTEAMPGVHGTESTPRSLLLLRAPPSKSKARLTSRAPARGAEWLTSVIARAASSVLRVVRRPSPAFVAVYLVRNTHTTQPVYDISVEEAECFYANGLLVHNCTQALMRVRAGGFIRLETDAADEDLGWGRKRAAYY